MMKRTTIPRTLLLGAALIWLTTCAVPRTAFGKSHIHVTLVPGPRSVVPGVPFDVLVRMEIEDGWHTYWKNPGDSGLAPTIAWELPPGFEAGPIEWPVPERFLEAELMTYGFEDEVAFPVRITPPATIAGDSVTIAAKIDWLECKEICIPGSAVVRHTLPVTPEAKRTTASAVTEARSRLPAAPSGWTFEAQAGLRTIEIAFRPPEGVRPRGAYFFADQPMVTEHAAPQGFEATGSGYRVTMTRAANAPRNLERLQGVLQWDGGGRSRTSRAVHVEVPVRAGDPAPAPVAPVSRGGPGVSTGAYTAIAIGIGVIALAALASRARRRAARPTPRP